MNTLLLSSLLLVAAADEPPKPKLPIGKDTTHVTGPLDKDGYIDYESALNAELSKNVKPEKNANVLLIMAFGPALGGGDGLPAAYFKWLDIPIPPKDGNYFLEQREFVTGKLGITGEKLEALAEVEARALQRAWVEKEAPPLAEWLKVNEKPLALIIEAVKRPQYLNPLVTERRDGERKLLIGALLPMPNACRSAAEALVLRAMLRLGEGKFDAAWEDLLACHRLARHVARGSTILEALIGYSIHRTATAATLAYLERAELTSQQVLAHLKQLRELPPIPSPANGIAFGDRFTCLDVLQSIRSGTIRWDSVLDPPTKQLTAKERKALELIDWSVPFRNTNKWFDRIAHSMRIQDRLEREREFERWEADFKKLLVNLVEPENRGKLVLDKDTPDKEAGRLIGDFFISQMMPAARKIQQAFDRATQLERNLHVAFAMAAYRKDNGKYPAKLADLAPKYLAAVPDDLFSGKPLIYKPTEKGYLFYSVGVNGEDDGGRGDTDEPRGDDLGVRIPLPELKKNK